LEEAENYVDTREQSLARLSKVTKELGVLIKKVVSRPKEAESAALIDSHKRLEDAVKGFVRKASSDAQRAV
jgi:hypothetical protein